MSCGIYKITNPINGLFYIGQSKDIERRWGEHKRRFKQGDHNVDAFQFDYDYLTSDFDYEIIEECTPEDLIMKEQEYIRNLNPAYNHEYYSSCREFICRCSLVGKRIEEILDLVGFDEEKLNVYPVKLFTKMGIELRELEFATRYCSEYVKCFGTESRDLMICMYSNSKILPPVIFVYDFDKLKRVEGELWEYTDKTVFVYECVKEWLND